MAQPTNGRASAVAGSTLSGYGDPGKDVGLLEYAGAEHWFDNGDLANQGPTGVLDYRQLLHFCRTGPYRSVDAANFGDLAGDEVPLRRDGGSVWLCILRRPN